MDEDDRSSSADELRHTHTTYEGDSAESHERASSVESARAAGQDGVVFVGGIVSEGVDPDMLEKVR